MNAYQTDLKNTHHKGNSGLSETIKYSMVSGVQ